VQDSICDFGHSPSLLPMTYRISLRL